MNDKAWRKRMRAAADLSAYDPNAYAENKAAADRALEAACDEIERKLGIQIRSLPAGTDIYPYAFLLHARRQVFFWRYADHFGHRYSWRNRRRREFLRAIRMAYQIATGWRGAVTRRNEAKSCEHPLKLKNSFGGFLPLPKGAF